MAASRSKSGLPVSYPFSKPQNTYPLNNSVNVFFRINQENHLPEGDDLHSRERARQEREFKIGSIGFADSSGILLASLLAVPTEIGLCRAQVARGKTLCSAL